MRGIVTLLLLVIGCMHHDLRALSQIRPELFVFTHLVAPHNILRGIKNGLGRAIILVEDHDSRLRKVAFEAQHILGAGPAPAIDHLIVIAHDTDIAPAFMVIIGTVAEQADQLVLWQVAVLELVNMDVLPFTLVTLQYRRFAPPEMLGYHQQIIKIDAIIVPQQPLVDLVNAGCNLFAMLPGLLRHLVGP